VVKISAISVQTIKQLGNGSGVESAFYQKKMRQHRTNKSEEYQNISEKWGQYSGTLTIDLVSNIGCLSNPLLHWY
jgi:hypothetical protein